MKPTRSQKRTETTLRSSVATGGLLGQRRRAERAERKLAWELLAAGGAGRHGLRLTALSGGYNGSVQVFSASESTSSRAQALAGTSPFAS